VNLFEREQPSQRLSEPYRVALPEAEQCRHYATRNPRQHEVLREVAFDSQEWSGTGAMPRDIDFAGDKMKQTIK
jgi:hypothetical protein